LFPAIVLVAALANASILLIALPIPASSSSFVIGPPHFFLLIAARFRVVASRDGAADLLFARQGIKERDE